MAKMILGGLPELFRAGQDYSAAIAGTYAKSSRLPFGTAQRIIDSAADWETLSRHAHWLRIMLSPPGLSDGGSGRC
jgi:hypothetical protein